MKVDTAAVILFVSLSAISHADNESEERKQQLKKWAEYYQEVADGYDVRLSSDKGTPLSVSAKPIHFYTNPSSGLDSHGAFFVWTGRGRAQAIGAIWSKQTGPNSARRYVHHELHSMATETFSATAKNLRWNPSEPGVALKVLEGAPKPAKLRTLRLAQMRSISRNFKGYHIHPVERQLRVLPQPIYRYEEVKGENLDTEDGAIFALFQEWDPEIMLLIESRETAIGEMAWHFSAGRFTNRRCRLEYRGVDVWEQTREDFGAPNKPFYAAQAVDERPAVFK